ncbi:hypothetical protein BC940DRAFT_296611 [Gongronella butleri]|nr:hypothetical protein BC940DRAFT_296611 [Gongronella butleri]
MQLLTSQARIYVICSFVSLGGFIFRYDTAVIAAYIAAPSFQYKFNINYATSGADAAVIAVTLGAGFLASFVSGFVADRLGRKVLLFIATLFNVVGSIIQVVGPNLAAFLSGRVITGFGLGTFTMLIPLYQSEIARPENRGRLITLYQVAVALGMWIGFWVVYGVGIHDYDMRWDVPLGLQLVPAGVLLLGLGLVPESPRWLIYRNRYNEALDIMALLRSQGNKDDLDLQMEFTGVRQDVWFDKHYTRKSFVGLWSTGIENNRTRTLLGMGIHICTQISGSNALIFYLPHIIYASGIVDRNMSLILGGGIANGISFLGTLPCFYFIDRWARRRVMVFGALVMGVSMLLVGLLSGLYDGPLQMSQLHFYADTVFEAMSSNNLQATYAMYALFCIYLAGFALSWAPVGWIYPAEIYPQMIRANAMGVTTATSYAAHLLMILVVPYMFESMKFGVYLFFGCVCLAMALLVHVYFPETKGKSLEEVNLLFSGALIDQRPGAHHPATAAEALLKMEQAQYREKRDRLARQQEDLDASSSMFPTEANLSGPISNVVRSLESNILLSNSNPLADLEKNIGNGSNGGQNGNGNTQPPLINLRRQSLNLLRPYQGRRPSLLMRRSSPSANDSTPSPPLPTTIEFDSPDQSIANSTPQRCPSIDMPPV